LIGRAATDILRRMANQYARISLISLSVAALISAIHHVLELGPRGSVIAFIFIPAAYGSLFWFKRSRSRAPYRRRRPTPASRRSARKGANSIVISRLLRM
jgi:hypothetical protein